MKEAITIKDVFTVAEREGEEKKWWTKIGIGFVNRDNSMNVILDAYPTNGRLHIRDREQRKNQPKEMP